MTFLANENFPRPSIVWLREKTINVLAVAELSPGISDEEVMKIAMDEGRTILTHDSDYGELIFKLGFKPHGGVVYYRLNEFHPEEPGQILLDLIEAGHEFYDRLTVINQNFNTGKEILKFGIRLGLKWNEKVGSGERACLIIF